MSQNIAAATVGNTPALADPPRREDTAQPPANSAASQASAVAAPAAPDIQSVDIDSLELSQPRSVGVEHVALHAIAQLGLVEKLTALGLSAVACACILGNLIGRMAAPASELATWEWLKSQSALGELLDVDFTGLSHNRLYRASDALMQHRDTIEAHVFGAATSLFAVQETVTLERFCKVFEAGLQKMADGLKKPRGEKPCRQTG